MATSRVEFASAQWIVLAATVNLNENQNATKLPAFYAPENDIGSAVPFVYILLGGSDPGVEYFFKCDGDDLRCK